MLIKESKMKRTLFVLTMLVVFSMLAGTAFADESAWGKAPDGVAASPTQNYILMGDQMQFDFLVLDPWFQPWPFYPIDISLYRPSTLAGWPLLQPPTAGTGWLMVDESEFRRQTWPKNKATNEFGLYQAKFMLPRENTWFPCGYPCRWQCDFYDGLADTWDRHAPLVLIALQTLPELLWTPLYWPNAIFGDPVAADAIHPLEAWAFEGDTFNALAIWEYEVDGYYWKPTDLEVEYPADYPDICPWMLP
jgi:hypothetical protein